MEKKWLYTLVVNIINKNFFFAKSIWPLLGSVKHY